MFRLLGAVCTLLILLTAPLASAQTDLSVAERAQLARKAGSAPTALPKRPTRSIVIRKKCGIVVVPRLASNNADDEGLRRPAFPCQR